MLGRGTKQRGDTIIEVMVALAVLGLAFAISYATANNALNVSQNNQEHSQALELLDSQVELARSDASDTNLYDTSGKWFCLHYDTTADSIKIQNFADNNISNAPANCKLELNGDTEYVVYAKYNQDKVNDVDQNNFTFTIKWPGLGNLGWQQEQINYKLHNIKFAAGGGSGAPVTCQVGFTGTPPNCQPPVLLMVTAKKIPPKSVPAGVDPTPSCSDSATQNEAGTGINLLLNGSVVQNQSTDSDSTVLFSGLSSGKSYTAKINSLPSGYAACAPSSGTQTVYPGLNPARLDFEIYPECWKDWEQTGYTQEYGVVGYNWTWEWEYGITGYTQVLESYWGVTGYGYTDQPYWGITGYQYIVTGGYWAPSGTGWTWIYTYETVPIYGWVDNWVYGPIYGWVYYWVSEPVYGWYQYWYQYPVWGWYTIPQYSWVYHCPS